MLTVTMVRKSDNSGYRLYITPEMEGYPADENQAAAYMNKIIEKEIMRARSNISGFIAVSRLARWEKRHSTSEKGRKAFYFVISHCHNIHIVNYSFLLLAISLLFTDVFTVSAASLNSDSSLSEIKLSPIPDTCKLLKVNKKMPLVSPHF